MYSPGYILKTDADFDNAILFRLPIQIRQHSLVLESNVIVKSHSFLGVNLEPDDRSYLKWTLEFRVMQPIQS